MIGKALASKVKYAVDLASSSVDNWNNDFKIM